MPSVVHIKELEGIIDEMVEVGNSASDILSCCISTVIESFTARNKPIPEKIKKLDIYRLI